MPHDQPKPPQFPNLALGADEERVITYLWQSLQEAGHLLARDQVRAALIHTDLKFRPPEAKAVQNN